MPRCGSCAQRANAASNSAAAPARLGEGDGRLRRVQVRTPLGSYGDPALVPGAIVYATGADIDVLIAAGALAVV